MDATFRPRYVEGRSRAATPRSVPHFRATGGAAGGVHVPTSLLTGPGSVSALGEEEEEEEEEEEKKAFCLICSSPCRACVFPRG